MRKKFKQTSVILCFRAQAKTSSEICENFKMKEFWRISFGKGLEMAHDMTVNQMMIEKL